MFVDVGPDKIRMSIVQHLVFVDMGRGMIRMAMVRKSVFVDVGHADCAKEDFCRFDLRQDQHADYA